MPFNRKTFRKSMTPIKVIHLQNRSIEILFVLTYDFSQLCIGKKLLLNDSLVMKLSKIYCETSQTTPMKAGFIQYKR